MHILPIGLTIKDEGEFFKGYLKGHKECSEEKFKEAKDLANKKGYHKNGSESKEIIEKDEQKEIIVYRHVYTR
jgi:hypothetical protein